MRIREKDDNDLSLRSESSLRRDANCVGAKENLEDPIQRSRMLKLDDRTSNDYSTQDQCQ